MAKYIKKPVKIEAEQWNFGDDPLEGMIAYGESILCRHPNYNGFYFIETLEGDNHVHRQHLQL